MKVKIIASVLLFAASFSFASVYMNSAEASYYAEKYHGRKTASGETFNMYSLTCAHKTLPFGTILRVTNLSNKKSVDVRVNDRGPFVKGRELDLSKAAAIKLDMVKTGTARVKIEIVNPKSDNSAPAAKNAVTVSHQTAELSKNVPYWDIQLGSFSSHDNANRLAQKLIKQGFENVYFQRTKSVTRVVLKKVPAKSLESTEEKLRMNGHSSFLVKESV